MTQDTERKRADREVVAAILSHPAPVYGVAERAVARARLAEKERLARRNKS